MPARSRWWFWLVKFRAGTVLRLDDRRAHVRWTDADLPRPPEPTWLRATVWRAELNPTLPANPGRKRALRKLRRDLVGMGDTAVPLSAMALVGGAEIVAGWQAARDDEYEEDLVKLRRGAAHAENDYQLFFVPEGDQSDGPRG